MKALSNNKKNNYTLALSFIIPSLFLLFIFIWYGFEPFGDGNKSLLAMDMAGQYSQFYKGLKHIGDQGSVFFSWSKALGSNYVGVFAYYLASPLSWLTLLCPNKYMASGILFLTILKIGLCGFSFAAFLKSRGIKNHVTVIFSTFYALMSYNLVYLMCLMWIDAVIWLPVILLLIDRFIKTGKWGLLCVSYAILFVSTYYMAYMCGIFTACYFIYRVFTDKQSKIGAKAVKTGKFALSVVTAGGLGAWLLLPALASLFDGKLNSDTSMIASLWEQSKETPIAYDSTNLLIKFFNGVYDSITNSGMPFFYCGVVVMIMLPAFFFVKSIKPGKKILLGSIIVFFVLSFNLTFLNYAWHVFQMPNWFPFRFGFLFLFVIIYAASVAFDRIKELPWQYFLAVLVVFAMISGIAYKIKHHAITTEDINVTVGLVTVCACLMLLLCYRKQTLVYVICVCMIVVTSVYDIGRHGYAMFEGIDNAHFYESGDEHIDYYSNMDDMIDYAREDSYGDLYRVGQSSFQSFNEPIGLGYSSVSHYSSAYNATVNGMLSDLGYGEYYYWVAPFGGSLISDMLLGVRYTIVSDNCSQQFPNIKILEHNNIPQTQYELIKEQNNFYLYKNQYALPVAFCTDTDILQYNMSHDPVVNQNNLLNSMLEEDRVYLAPLQSSVEKVKGAYTYTITASCDGAMYATFPNKGYSRANAYVNDKYYMRLYSAELECLMYLGYFHQGETVTVTVDISRYDYNTTANRFYMLDMAAFHQAAEELHQGGMTVSSYGEGFVEGTILADSNKAVFTSIPYDEGWHIYVDGSETNIQSAAGFLAFEVSEGQHNVTMRYYAKGQKAGFCITLITALLIYAVYQLRRVYKVI